MDGFEIVVVVVIERNIQNGNGRIIILIRINNK